MLENYIERNISRKVYLCEQLFEFQEIDIEYIAKMLGVTMLLCYTILKVSPNV